MTITRGALRALPLLVAGLLGGCAQLLPDFGGLEEGSEQLSRVDKHSSYPAIRRSVFEQINLIELVDPHREAENLYPLAWAIAMGRMDTDRDSSFGLRYDLALAAFRERPDQAQNHKQAHRDAVQDRILSVSTSRCNVFKTYLRRQQADVNYYLGSATTIAGVLGAVLPGATASRNLAGAAGLFSGLQAEYNSNYYSNLAAHVIVQGIETHQARLLTKLVEERRKRTVAEYGMEAAIKDAIHFDGTCSTVVGLLEAAESIKEVTNPGIPRAAEIIASVRAMNQIAQAQDFDQLRTSGELQQLLKQASPSASPLVVSAAGAAAANGVQRLGQSAAAVVRLSEYLRGQSVALLAALERAQKDLPASSQLDETGRSAVFAALAAGFRSLEAKSGLAVCVDALKAPSEAFARATAARDLAQAGTLARVQAEGTLGQALAEVGAAIERVEWRLSHEQTVAGQQANDWRAELVKPKPDAGKLILGDKREQLLAAQQCPKS